MDLHYLEIFNTVAQYESYKKASDILHISQPALSVQIKKLEGQIGLKLFDKIGNRVYLSENGIMLQEYTRRIFGICKRQVLSSKKWKLFSSTFWQIKSSTFWYSTRGIIRGIFLLKWQFFVW